MHIPVVFHLELEGIPDRPGTAYHARQTLTKLRACDDEFKNLHFQVIDSINERDNTALDNEQTVLDNFDDTVSDLTVRLETLISRVTAAAAPGPAAAVDRRPLDRKLTRVESGLDRINAQVTNVDPIPERANFRKNCLTTRKTWLFCMKTLLRETLLMMMHSFVDTPNWKGSCQACHRS